MIGSPARLTQGTVAENLHLRLGGDPDQGAPYLPMDAARAAFDRVELSDDMFQLGLRTVVDAGRHQALVEAVLAAREALRQRLQDPEYAGLIEPFERDHYLENATLGENLIFGVPLVPEFEGPALARNALVRRVLREVELEDELLALGWEAWRNLSELFGDLPPHHSFFANFSPLRPEDLPLYRQRLGSGDSALPVKLTRERRNLLLGLTLNLAPARDRLVDLPEGVIGKLLQARQLFAAQLPKTAADAVEFFEPGRYLATLSVRDNLIFGRIVTRHGRANERLKELITRVADDGGFREQVVAAGPGLQRRHRRRPSHAAAAPEAGARGRPVEERSGAPADRPCADRRSRAQRGAAHPAAAARRVSRADGDLRARRPRASRRCSSAPWCSAAARSSRDGAAAEPEAAPARAATG